MQFKSIVVCLLLVAKTAGAGNNSEGYIELVTGPMFAGKSSKIIEYLAKAESDGHRVMAFKHVFDKSRAGSSAITSHDEKTYPAIATDDVNEILEKSKNAKVLGIDEMQFFVMTNKESSEESNKKIDMFLKELQTRRDAGQIIYIDGLNLTFEAKSFGRMPEVEGIADTVTSLYANCSKCKQKDCAVYSQRISDCTDEIQVGGAEAYEPRCSECFVFPEDHTK